MRADYAAWYTELVTALPEVKQGMVRPPEGAGLGLALDPELRGRPDAHVRPFTAKDL